MRRLQTEGIDVWGHDFVTAESMIAKLAPEPAPWTKASREPTL